MRMQLIFLVLFLAQAANALQRLNLKEAILRNLVSASFSNIGSHSGRCMKMQISNRGKDSLFIIVPAGTRLNAKNETEQDILLVKQEEILLRKQEQKTVELKGYCCAAHKRGPSAGGKYTFVDNNDSSFFQLARYLDRSDFNSTTEQQAVWVLSNKHSIAGIPDSTESLNTLRHLLSSLSGQIIPWYAIEQKIYVSASRVMYTIPLNLSGQIPYSSTEASYATCIIKNSEGLTVGQIASQWLPAGAGQNYFLELPVKNLGPGKYSISLENSKETLATKQFEL